MTHDEGPIKIYATKNTGEAGDMPASGRVLIAEEYYGSLTIGISRYYTAMSNGQRIDKLIEIWPVEELDTSCAIVIDGEDYIVRQVQYVVNSDGLKVQTVALERIDRDERES